jgi:hypothetical protein
MSFSRRLILVLLLAPLAPAADPFYVGVWKVASASVAPWWKEPKLPADAEMKTLVGKTVTIEARSIRGPRQFACPAAKYKVTDYTAEMLFQGSFGEMRASDKSVDPAKVAATLGFKGSSWKTIETGCGNEVDYHFLDPMTAAIGLNNYICILQKQ